jgi:hypothetical protein
MLEPSDPNDPQLPIQTLVRATSGTGDGLVGVAGSGTTGATSVRAIPAWQLIAVRAARAGLQTIAASLGIGATGLPEYVLNISYTDFETKFKLALVLGVGTAAASILQDTIEFLKNIDVTHPQFRG